MPGSPHTRGDGPAKAQAPAQDSQDDVVPTRVGMDRGQGGSPEILRRSPHTRGDGPIETDRDILADS